MFAAEGLQRTRRVLARYCQTERLIAKKDAGPNGDEWFVNPTSIPRAIAELKMLHRKTGLPELILVEPDRDSPGQTETVLDDMVPKEESYKTQGLAHPVHHPEAVRPSRSEPDRDSPGQTETALDIFEHPYVKRLEREIDGWKNEATQWKEEFKGQVERTRQIQTQSFDKLIELQRLVQVGQSKTLADFFLKTKDWLLGAGPGAEAPDNEDAKISQSRSISP